MVELKETRVQLPGDYKLDVEFSALWLPDGGFDYETYGYHLSKPGVPRVWRYDKHRERKFEEQFGTDCHVHNEDGTVEPTGTVELDEVIVRVQAEYEKEPEGS